VKNLLPPTLTQLFSFKCLTLYIVQCLWKEVLSQQRIRHFKILQSIYFAHDVGISSSYFKTAALIQIENIFIVLFRLMSTGFSVTSSCYSWCL